MIREIHKAAIENNVDILAMLSRPPVPAVILKSKDDKGITALHKVGRLAKFFYLKKISRFSR